jgi:rRNA small subunit pseudouridine methyltransferase Nep1
LEKIDIIFLESSLETIPKEIKGSSKKTKTYNEILDINIHYKNMLKLRDFSKRGRPDIIHYSLLNILEKPFVTNGYVNVYMHVYDDRVYKFNNNIRIPKNYDRFKGLMAQLLKYNKVPPESEDPLIFLVSKNLNEFVKNRKILLLSENGEDFNVEGVINIAIKEGLTIGIGAFAHGDFKQEIDKIAYKKARLYKGLKLKAWDITCAISSKLMEMGIF